MNTTDFQAKTKMIMAKVAAQAPLAVKAGGELIASDTRPDVPIDRGVLRISGVVDAPTGISHIATCAVRWSAKAPHNGYDYAWKQHEYEFNHPKGGKDHYLSDVILKDTPQALQIIGETVKRVL